MSSATPQQGGQDRCVWDALVPGPSGREPLGDEPQFAEILEGMVAAFAPRVFAVVQVYGERVDGRIAAWGMAFEDHVKVFGVDGWLPMTMQEPEDALPGFAWGRHITTRLVWGNPAAGAASRP